MIHQRTSSETHAGAVSGTEDKVKTGGKKFDEPKYVEFFPARFDFVFGPTNCPWVSKDGDDITQIFWLSNILNCSILHVICIAQFTKSTPKKYGMVLTSTKYVLF